MTLHTDEFTDTWHVRRSEVFVPSSYHLVGILVMGIFALSLTSAGALYSIFRLFDRRWGRK